MWANQPISPLHPRSHSEGSRNTSDLPEASAPRSRTQADPTAKSPPHPSPRGGIVRLRLARDWPLTLLSHWRAWDPLWHHPRSRVYPTGQAKNDQGQITMPATATGMGKSCWPLCHPYWHYSTIRACTVYITAALGHYFHDRDKIAPLFPPPRPRSSTPSQTTRTNTPRRLQDQVWQGTSLQCQKTKTTPPAVAHVPEHVAAVPEVPTPCLHSADHAATG
jgi:hypothetical protein